MERPATKRVLVRKVTDLETDVAEALDFLEYDFAGKKVWVKPNLLAPHPPEAGVTTDPELVRQIVRGLRARGAAQVWVADNPAGVHRGSLAEYLAPTSIVAASEGCFRNISESSLLLPVNSRFITQLPVSTIITEVDVILNLPVFKTHGLTIITGAVKNIFGIIPGGHKAYLHTVAANAAEFAELLVDIYQAVPKPLLHIMDGLRGMDGPSGPSSGRVLKIGRLLASSNGVALDAVMTLMANGKPAAIPTNRIANERGLGPIDPNEIAIVGDFQPVQGFRLPWPGLAAAVARASVPVYSLLRRAPVLNRRRCIRCQECGRNCPAQAITLSPYPEINRRKCINCYCCVEICPVRAMTVAGIPYSLWLRITGH